MDLAGLLSKGLSEIPFNILAFVVFAWTTNKHSEKQQELVMIHNEQMNKMIESNSELVEGLAELVFATNEASSSLKKIDERTISLEEKIDKLAKQQDEIEDSVIGLKRRITRQGED